MSIPQIQSIFFQLIQCYLSLFDLIQIQFPSISPFKIIQLMSTENNQASVRIFIRNTKKIGKIANLPQSCSTGQLYAQAATLHKLSIAQFHLQYQGKLIPLQGQIQLHQKSIIHLIDIAQVHLDNITIQIKQLEGQHPQPIKFEVSSDTTIKQFIDTRLKEIYGEGSNTWFLIHNGRQLKLNLSFSDQDIECDSQLTAVDVGYAKRQRERQAQKAAEQQKVEENQPALDIKDLQTPSEPTDIYPTPDFIIGIPQEINANANLDLIFNSSKHGSSLRNYDLEPQEIIPEQSKEQEYVGVSKSIDNMASDKDERQQDKQNKEGEEEYNQQIKDNQNNQEKQEPQLLNQQNVDLLIDEAQTQPKVGEETQGLLNKQVIDPTSQTVNQQKIQEVQSLQIQQKLNQIKDGEAQVIKQNKVSQVVEVVTIEQSF